MGKWGSAARTAVERCRLLASYTEEPGRITRTYLSPPMKGVHALIGGWLRGAGAFACQPIFSHLPKEAGCSIRIDAVGNLRITRVAARPGAPLFVIGSHLDTVPNAGAFDGILGVVLGVALLEDLAARALPFAIELIGFSEEEGVRYGVPFIGSRAAVSSLDASLIERISGAIRDFGLDPTHIPEARLPDSVFGYLEFHIEQGPVLDELGLPLGIVEGIAGQSRL